MEDIELEKIMKAISDPTRIRILQLLPSDGGICACRLLENLKITQGTLSHHMKVLCEAGLVNCAKDGKWCHYTINQAALDNLVSFLSCLGKGR